MLVAVAVTEAALVAFELLLAAENLVAGWTNVVTIAFVLCQVIGLLVTLTADAALLLLHGLELGFADVPVKN